LIIADYCRHMPFAEAGASQRFSFRFQRRFSAPGCHAATDFFIIIFSFQ